LNEGSPDAACAVVLCHPHPLGGGSLHNKVVYHAMKAMNAREFGLEWPVLRFNFRGTGRSEGEHDGAAETGDVLAALAWVENEYRLPIVVAGFSFGAAMALRACCGDSSQVSKSSPGAARMNVRAIAALGLPVRSGTAATNAKGYDYGYLSDCPIPKLFLSGDNDQFATKTELIKTAGGAAEAKHVALVPGADHFFTGHLDEMQRALSGWLKEQVYDPGQRSYI